MTHYGSNPYDALYGGYFLDLSTARQYCSMYIASDKEPYHKNNLTKQVGRAGGAREARFLGGAGLGATGIAREQGWGAALWIAVGCCE